MDQRSKNEDRRTALAQEPRHGDGREGFSIFGFRFSIRERSERGFTLIELMVVVAIIGILAVVALPAMRTAPLKAREAVLKADLYQIRSCIDQYLGDKGQYPESLQGLVDSGYLRFVPIDPITRSPDTWIELQATPSEFEELEPIEEDLGGFVGIIDIQSGAGGVALDGSLYSEW
jgi:general secretion pathway protein G